MYTLNDLLKLVYEDSQTPVTKALSIQLWNGPLGFVKSDTPPTARASSNFPIGPFSLHSWTSNSHPWRMRVPYFRPRSAVHPFFWPWWNSCPAFLGSGFSVCNGSGVRFLSPRATLKGATLRP